MGIARSTPLKSFHDSVWIDALHSARQQMYELLQAVIRIPSVSGNEAAFVHFVNQWAKEGGFVTDLWQSDERELAEFPLSHAKHIPLAGRPTLVVRLPGKHRGPNLLFNAHSDVVGAGDEKAWRFGPWSGAEEAGRIYGRGACDVKGPLVSALWAMLALKQSGNEFPGNILLELIPGEEDCVGLGTLTSVARGYRADAAVILEPTGNIPRCASRGGCRFEITCTGRAVHGTAKWLGVDAIQSVRRVLDLLDTAEKKWNDRHADPLFAQYPIARPITVDAVHGGGWQGMICDNAICTGYLELLPGDNPEEWKQALSELVRDEFANSELGDKGVAVRFIEEYAGHRTSTDQPICMAANQAVEKAFDWSGFNSGCEAGLRATLHGTPTLVWGPGDLSHAHAIDESIAWQEVEQAAGLFSRFAYHWMDLSKEGRS